MLNYHKSRKIDVFGLDNNILLISFQYYIE